MPRSFSIKLHSETQVSGRLGVSRRRSLRHAQNPLSSERRKTLSVTHHALSPHPYIILCTSFHLINWLQRFYRITMSLKRPFVPKNDVIQWFITTTISRPIRGLRYIVTCTRIPSSGVQNMSIVIIQYSWKNHNQNYNHNDYNHSVSITDL